MRVAGTLKKLKKPMEEDTDKRTISTPANPSEIFRST